jgi:hypothetical protein
MAGLIAGVIVGVPMMAGMLLMKEHPPSQSMGMLIGYTTMLIALSMIFLAVKQQRDVAQGGVISFWKALGMGLAISVVAGIIYVLAWEATLAVSGVDYAGHFADVYIKDAQAKGMSGAALDKLIADMEQFKRDYANPAYRMPVTFTEIFPVGILISLISAALLRNPRFMPAKR